MNKCQITGDLECKCNQIITVLQGNLNVKELLRKLFSEHAFFTWLFIATFNSPENTDITNRLLKNQEDIGDALAKVLNNTKIGNQLTELLKQHILRAAGAVDALYKYGENSNELKQSVKNIFENSTQVAQFLSKISPKLPFETVKKEFDQHNQYVIDIATAHYRAQKDKKQYQIGIGLGDKYYDHMLMFSDILAKALEKPMSNEQSGGKCDRGCGCGDNYKQKYMKYKSKYIHSKKN